MKEWRDDLDLSTVEISRRFRYNYEMEKLGNWPIYRIDFLS